MEVLYNKHFRFREQDFHVLAHWLLLNKYLGPVLLYNIAVMIGCTGLFKNDDTKDDVDEPTDWDRYFVKAEEYQLYHSWTQQQHQQLDHSDCDGAIHYAEQDCTQESFQNSVNLSHCRSTCNRNDSFKKAVCGTDEKIYPNQSPLKTSWLHNNLENGFYINAKRRTSFCNAVHASVNVKEVRFFHYIFYFS